MGDTTHFEDTTGTDLSDTFGKQRWLGVHSNLKGGGGGLDLKVFLDSILSFEIILALDRV